MLPVNPLGASWTSQGSVIVNALSHPVTAGVGDFVSPSYVEWGEARLNATVLAVDTGGNPAVTVWSLGAGRVVYLSPIYFASYSTYENEGLLDGSIPQALQLFLQAVEWAGGS